MKALLDNLFQLIFSGLLILHTIFKNFVLYTTALILEFSNQLLNLYSSLEIFLGLWAALFVNYSYLQFLSFSVFIHQLYEDIFSFEHRLLKAYFLLLFMVTVAIGNALNYNKFLTETILECLFVICYLYIAVLIFLILFLILLHFKTVSCCIWCIFLENYHDSFGYKVLTNIILVYLFNYYLVDKSTKKHYIVCFFILLFGWFANYFVYQNFEIISSSKIDPVIDLLISLGLNWTLYEIIYYFVDRTDPEFIKTYQKWNKWLDSLTSNSFIEKLPLRWFLFIWFFISYIWLILMGLI